MTLLNKPTLCLACALLSLGSQRASAVMIDPSGRGEVLLMPYYTVNAGQQTLLSVVNHSNTGKAVKIRFLERRNGREVQAFNLYLAEFDVWTAALFADGDGGETRLLTNDNSCTLPAIKASSTLPQLSSGTRYLSFYNTDYSGPRADGGPTDLARTREGYIELVEMGALVNNSELDLAVSHVGGIPRDCEALELAWQTGAHWAIDPAFGLLPPSGQLSGNASIVDVQGGAVYSVDATALSRFSVVVQHSRPDAATPNLSSAVTEIARENVESTTIADGRIFRSFWPQARAVDAVTAALTTSRVLNEFNGEPEIGARSDWVITFPTQRFYPRPQSFAPSEPFVVEGARMLCVLRDRTTGTTHDRESRRPTRVLDLPGQAFREEFYCGATQVMAFRSQDSLLGAREPRSFSTSFGSTDVFMSGWLNLRFQSVNRTAPALSGERYLGVPAIGFWALRYRNNAAKPGELGIYSSAIPHQRSIDCVDAQGQPCASL